MENINNIMQELAQYLLIKEETDTIIESLKDVIKSYMVLNNIDTLSSTEHKASYKDVTSKRFDSKRLSKEYPELVDRFTTSTTSKRFTFS